MEDVSEENLEWQRMLADLTEEQLQALHRHLLRAVSGNTTDPNVSDLCETLARMSDDLPSLYQMNVAIRIKHSMFEDRVNFIQAENDFTCDIVNWKATEQMIEPFQTLVPQPVVAGRPSYILRDYAIWDMRSQRQVFGLALGDIVHSKHALSGEEVFTSSRCCAIPPKTTFHLVYQSTRIIPLHDTYMYSARTRPSRGLLLNYDYSSLASELGRVGVELHPKLTAVSRTAELHKRETEKESGKAEWEMRGWFLLGNGVVLSW